MPPGQSQQTDPYGFITNPGKPKRGPLFGGGMKMKLALIGFVTIILLIIGVVISNMLGAADSVQKDKLIKLVQTQTEIVRISSTASNKAASPETRALAVNTKLTVGSASNQTKDALAKYGVKSDAKLLAGGKDAKSDATLDTATKTSRFDEAYKKLLYEQLNEYQKQLKDAFETGTKKQKVFLNNAGSSNTLILSTIKQT